MTVLVRMSEEAYGPYLENAISGYAQSNVESGRWPEEGALERSQANFESSLPQGLETPNNYLYEIKAAETGPTVGVIWFAVEERHGLLSAFVYDVEIKPGFRRLGHAKAAFEALELLVRELGLSSIGLHVFGHNPEAQALYNKLGYRVTGNNMIKDISTSST
jgi:ribosomal protein S18 acetylase RimI-like enzyme